ncbi:MAG TPA: tetratricopeptide repeat protein [Candidatus Paceibacterota bacterium]|nr:tetratricopeptide repeat protein [Candidatus Paceibacterota bacterium]
MKPVTPLKTPSSPQLLPGHRHTDPTSEIKAWCLERADEWHDQNQPVLARQFLQHALAIDPHDVQCWIALGSLHFTGGNLDSALLAFTQANELKPADPAIILHLALTHQHRKEWAETEWYFRRTLELRPDDVATLKLFSGYLMARGRHEEARHRLEQALAFDLDDVELFLRLGVCCYQLNDFSAAHACFKRALQLDPNNQMARENLFVSHSRLIDTCHTAQPSEN